jgi:glycine cleavage system H protein
MSIPSNLKYTRIMNGLASKDVATVGITFCTKELGDIVYVEVETLDQTLEKMRFWYGRGSKTVSDLFYQWQERLSL